MHDLIQYDKHYVSHNCVYLIQYDKHYVSHNCVYLAGCCGRSTEPADLHCCVASRRPKVKGCDMQRADSHRAPNESADRLKLNWCWCVYVYCFVPTLFSYLYLLLRLESHLVAIRDVHAAQLKSLQDGIMIVVWGWQIFCNYSELGLWLVK